MVYDPAWDMPKRNWQPQGSFEQGLIPLTVNPDDAPLVCLPPINVHWLPLVLGCLDQLRNPSTWIAANDDAMFAVLQKSQRLMQMIGERATCVDLAMRLQDCALQFSIDGGATWTTVSNWNPGFEECVQEFLPIIGLPPNPGDEPHNQFACSIAGYLANDVILKAITQAITSISDDIALLGFGTVILDLIPEFVLVTVAYNALYFLYSTIQGGTIADYEAARDDPALWQDVQCAIYGCIVSTGYVTPANFPCILAEVGAITYTHSDVIDLIVAFLTNLGATGLAQLSQRAGLVPGADCSSCVNWCYEWSPMAQEFDANWVPGGGGGDAEAVYDPIAKIFRSIAYPDMMGTYTIECAVEADLPGWHVNQIGVSYSQNGGGDITDRYVQINGSTLLALDFDAGSWTTTTFPDTNIDHVRISVRTRLISLPLENQITLIRFKGDGINPFGSNNCSS